jgi:hypothetical protein
MESRNKIQTSGNGLWSNAIKEVQCIGFIIPYINEENDFGELRVVFDTNTWNVDEDGLIYTDPAFLDAIREAFGTKDIEYSEAGMQGTNFVSFDVGQEFLTMYEKT